MTNCRFVFFGTPERAVKTLKSLAAISLVPELIVTAPPQRQGRGMHLSDSSVAQYAREHGIEALTPAKITPEVVAELVKRGVWDFYLVVAYGKLLPESLIESVQGKVINIHPSLLPHYRGPSPFESVLLSDDSETGVTIMQIDKEVDHGPIIAQMTLPLPRTITKETLEDQSIAVAVALIAETLQSYLAGQLTPTRQDHEQATFTRKFEKIDGNLDTVESDWEKWKRYRAFTPGIGVYFHTQKKDTTTIRLKITRAHFSDEIFSIDEVIPENGKPQSYQHFIKNQHA